MFVQKKKIGDTTMKKKLPIIMEILKGLGTFFAVLLSTVGTLLCFSIVWMFDTWSNLTMDEMMYHLKAPLEGTNEGMIQEYLNTCAVPAILVFILVTIILLSLREKKRLYNIMIGVGIVLPVLISMGYIKYTWDTLDVGNYVKGQSDYSTFIDDNYVDPRDVEVRFPEQKRNLIYIFLESMETTYADKENGGAFEENVIPELTTLAEENEDFSGIDKGLNGGYAMPGTTWTIGGMFAQTSGIPLSISIDGNSMDTQDTFFANTVTLGDILQQEGYSQTLMIGSDATFGGRRLYFTEHGNYDILDYNYAHDNGWIPEDYRVWWGYEDEKLFGFAKEQLLQLAEEGNPFNFTMLTVDTHFEDGYPCNLCPDTYGDDQYSNVMACSSRQVAEFVAWIQQQSFYENTTIVISGDHPTMDSDFCQDVDSDYMRKVYTAYINPAAEVSAEDTRNYTTFDNFPTTVASLGADIDGDRLGLGTNLFSATPTLTERFGIDKVKSEMSRKSKLMETLADINEDSEALMIREGKSPAADLTVGAYDYETGLFSLAVNNFVNVDTGSIQSMSAAVWTEDNQSDLQWIPLDAQEEGSYAGAVKVPNFDYKTGTYHVHVYMTDNNGEATFLGEIETQIE